MSDRVLRAPPAGGATTTTEPQGSAGVAIEGDGTWSLPTPATPGGFGGSGGVKILWSQSASGEKPIVYPALGLHFSAYDLVLPDATNSVGNAALERHLTLMQAMVSVGRLRVTPRGARWSSTIGSSALLGGAWGRFEAPGGRSGSFAGLAGGSRTSVGLTYDLDAARTHHIGAVFGIDLSSPLILRGDSYVSQLASFSMGLQYLYTPRPQSAVAVSVHEHTAYAESIKVVEHALRIAGGALSGLGGKRDQGLANDFISDVTGGQRSTPSTELRDASVVIAAVRMVTSSGLLGDFATAQADGWRIAYAVLQGVSVATDFGMFGKITHETDNPAVAADKFGSGIAGALRLVSMLGHDQHWWTPAVRFYGMQATSGIFALLAQMPIGKAQQLFWESHVAVQADLMAAPALLENDFESHSAVRIGIGGFSRRAGSSASRGVLAYNKEIRFPGWATAIELGVVLSAPQLSVDNMNARAKHDALPGVAQPATVEYRVGVPWTKQFAAGAGAFRVSGGLNTWTDFDATNMSTGFGAYGTADLMGCFTALENSICLGAGIDMTGGYNLTTGPAFQITPTLVGTF